MPPKAKNAAVVALAEAMLRELEVLRERGAPAYPPRLRHLATLTGSSSTDEHVQEAAGKKAFTARAVVTVKVGKKPSLDGPVYFKEDAPKPDPAGELAVRMIAVLASQRLLGADAYPPTLRRLAELCDVKASETHVPGAAGHAVLTDRAIVAAKSGKKPSLDAPVVLREDLVEGIAKVLPSLLRFSLAPVTTRTKGKESQTVAFSAEDASKRLVPELKEPILGALKAGVEREDMPADVAWVLVKGKPLLFLVENVRPGAGPLSRPAIDRVPRRLPVADAAGASPARRSHDFAAAFREAFEHLDRGNGATNFVKLADLRRELPGFGRDEFDAGLRSLRLDGEFSLDSHEGLSGSLTPSERDAGVREAGSLLIYVSRR